MAISAAFAQILAAGRAQFNQRVTEARRRYPAFDSGAFADFLQAGVDKVVMAIADTMPEKVASTTLVAYDIALELAGLTLAGPKARDGLVNRVWEEVLPVHARLIADHPVEVIGRLSNAAVNISRVASTRPDQWVQAMCALAPQVGSLAHLQGIGQILSWRCGLAHFRAGAIEVADQLPEQLALAAFGCQEEAPWSQVKAKLLADPWWVPVPFQKHSIHPGTEIGQFTGFGGEFSEPPEVRPCPEGFFVRSGQRYSLLIADAFGAVLHAATEEDFKHAVTHHFADAITLKGNRLITGKREIDLNLPADHIQVTHNAHTIAVTSPFTHAIRLLPLQ